MIATTQSTRLSDEAIIGQMIIEWSEALAAKDLDRLLSQYAADIVLFDVKPPYKIEGLPAYRKVWEESFSCFPQKLRSEHRDLHITVSGDVAFVHCLHRIVPIDEAPPNGQTWLRVTVGYRRFEGRWRIVHEHVSLPIDFATGQVAYIDEPAVV